MGESDIAVKFRELVEKFRLDLADTTKYDEEQLLLDTLVADLEEAGADHWYSSSANC